MANARRGEDGLTDKQRAYVALRVGGARPDDAYLRAFKSGPVANHATVRKAAEHLERMPKIVQAIATARERAKRLEAEVERRVVDEASSAIAREIVLTRAAIIDELWGNAMKAKQAVPVLDKSGKPTGYFTANWAASNRALELLGKEIGMFKEAKEPDLFEKLSPEQVRALKAAIDSWVATCDGRADPAGGNGGAGPGDASGSPPRTIN